LDIRKKILLRKSSNALKQAAQGSHRVTVLGGIKVLRPGQQASNQS